MLRLSASSTMAVWKICTKTRQLCSLSAHSRGTAALCQLFTNCTGVGSAHSFARRNHDMETALPPGTVANNPLAVHVGLLRR